MQLGHPALLGGLFGAIGNPLSDDTWTYTWQNGRQLHSMTKPGKTMTYVYNEQGLRVQKTQSFMVMPAQDPVTTNYTLHGKNIVHMTQGSNELHFFYDAQNKPAVVVYNGTAYSYVKNLQGDIVAILDSAGSVVVEYKYDAWGRPINKTGSMASTLGTVQPFRYRGYVYDEETGLYYLRSRYYNPTCCRFVNMDSVLLKGLLVSNQQAYCCNNPVLHSDSNGRNLFEDLWYLFQDTVNASQEVEQYNIQTEHEAWQDAGEAIGKVANAGWNLFIDMVNEYQRVQLENAQRQAEACGKFANAVLDALINIETEKLRIYEFNTRIEQAKWDWIAESPDNALHAAGGALTVIGIWCMCWNPFFTGTAALVVSIIGNTSTIGGLGIWLAQSAMIMDDGGVE